MACVKGKPAVFWIAAFMVFLMPQTTEASAQAFADICNHFNESKYSLDLKSFSWDGKKLVVFVSSSDSKIETGTASFLPRDGGLPALNLRSPNEMQPKWEDHELMKGYTAASPLKIKAVHIFNINKNKKSKEQQIRHHMGNLWYIVKPISSVKDEVPEAFSLMQSEYNSRPVYVMHNDFHYNRKEYIIYPLHQSYIIDNTSIQLPNKKPDIWSDNSKYFYIETSRGVKNEIRFVPFNAKRSSGYLKLFISLPIGFIYAKDEKSPGDLHLVDIKRGCVYIVSDWEKQNLSTIHWPKVLTLTRKNVDFMDYFCDAKSKSTRCDEDPPQKEETGGWSLPVWIAVCSVPAIALASLIGCLLFFTNKRKKNRKGHKNKTNKNHNTSAKDKKQKPRTQFTSSVNNLSSSKAASSNATSSNAASSNASRASRAK